MTAATTASKTKADASMLLAAFRVDRTRKEEAEHQCTRGNDNAYKATRRSPRQRTKQLSLNGEALRKVWRTSDVVVRAKARPKSCLCDYYTPSGRRSTSEWSEEVMQPQVTAATQADQLLRVDPGMARFVQYPSNQGNILKEVLGEDRSRAPPSDRS